jgi:HPt (histidine-containing phosphotransfer) domain-containing protein
LRLGTPDIAIGNSPEHNEVDPAFAEVWVRNLPSIGAHLGEIERAVRAVEEGGLGAGLAVDARTAAHKLAGSLGSFGLAHGSELARELERRFEPGGDPVDPREAAQLVSELRNVIEREAAR